MKIAFCKYGGLAAGGTEKYLQSLALLYDKSGHQIDYYYTNATPIEGTDWKHPDTCPDRKLLLQSSGINTILVETQERRSNSEWVNTNFFKLFKESNYDYLVTAGDGRTEYPYYLIRQIPIIHTIHGWHVNSAPNIHKSVLLCKWQADKWLSNGGDSNKLVIIPPLIPAPDFTLDFRQTHNISTDAFVFGLHQAAGVASLVSLEAFAKIISNNVYYVILGGDDQHRSFCKYNNIKNVIFLPFERDITKIHSFLNGIDVYAHCRNDGEVCSASIIEAMSHRKPIISYIGNGTNIGHIEQINGVGTVASTVSEYANEMSKCFDKSYYMDLTTKVYQRYTERYEYNIVANKLLGLL